MKEDQARLEELYLKWFHKTATAAERAEFRNLLEAGVSREQLTPVLYETWQQLKEDGRYTLQQKNELANRILEQWPAEPVIKAAPRLRSFRLVWMAAAAILLLATLATAWYWINKTGIQKQPPVNVMADKKEVIGPATNGAILTLADGRQIVLDSAANGLLSDQQGAQVILKQNKVIYEGVADGSAAQAFNTMATPKGRQFQLVLPDGTKVWLNAATSLKYPVVFAAHERKVELNGEAYFEVTHDPAKPFRVQTVHQQVQALGTAFNVHAYDNESTEKTTLVEGKVLVKRTAAAPQEAILNPGQQAAIDQQAAMFTLLENQAEAALAWKNGYFYLENMPFELVMKQLERWYDIQVQYKGGVPNLRFVGGLSRNMTLDALLRALQVSEVHFKMEPGRKLIVFK